MSATFAHHCIDKKMPSAFAEGIFYVSLYFSAFQCLQPIHAAAHLAEAVGLQAFAFHNDAKTHFNCFGANCCNRCIAKTERAAATVGITENHAGVKLSRMRAKLKKILEEEGITV